MFKIGILIVGWFLGLYYSFESKRVVKYYKMIDYEDFKKHMVEKGQADTIESIDDRKLISGLKTFYNIAKLKSFVGVVGVFIFTFLLSKYL